MNDITNNAINIDAHPDEIITATKKILPKTVASLDSLFSGCIDGISERLLKKVNDSKKMVSSSYEEKYTRIPKERRIDPPYQVCIGVDRAIEECASDKYIHDMFANILAKSCDSKYVEQIHPAFLGIIKEMSVFEAQLIMRTALLSQKDLPCCKMFRQDISFSDIKLQGAVADFQIFRQGTFIGGVFLLLGKEYDDKPEKVMLAIDNLCRMGLLTIDFEHEYDQKSYFSYSESCFFKKIKEELKDNYKGIFLQKGIVARTSLGTKLYEICCH